MTVFQSELRQLNEYGKMNYNQKILTNLVGESRQ